MINFVNRNLVTYQTISSQIECLRSAIEGEGVEFEICQDLKQGKSNFLIEGFEDPSIEEIREFHSRTGERIFLILTEHMEFINGELFWNTESIRSNSEYMPLKIVRLKKLVDLLPYVQGFLTIGHLPELKDIEKYFPSVPLYRAPLSEALPMQTKRNFSLSKAIFFGRLTKFREQMLVQLSDTFNIHVVDTFPPQDRLIKIIEQRGIGTSISIPQYPDWKWESPIRTLIALNANVLPINIWPDDNHHRSLMTIDYQMDFFSQDREEIFTSLDEAAGSCFSQYNDRRVQAIEADWFTKLNSAADLKG